MNRLSSLRTTLAPMPSTPMLISLPEFAWPQRPSTRGSVLIEAKYSNSQSLKPYGLRLFRGLRDLHPPGGIQHRLDDVVVAGAAADVAFELVADGGLVELPAM